MLLFCIDDSHDSGGSDEETAETPLLDQLEVEFDTVEHECHHVTSRNLCELF